MQQEYRKFLDRLQLMIQQNKDIAANTLSNIFTMRLIGNKTHGDLAEVGIAEFINQFMQDYSSVHVGKDLFRAKKKEEDIVVVSKLTNEKIPVSLKAYGIGPLQLSTDKEAFLFPYMEKLGKRLNTSIVTSQKDIDEVLSKKEISDIFSMNILPLIYEEKSKRCNIMVFDFDKAKNAVKKIERVEEGEKGRKHPIWKFLDADGNYILEIRYGNKAANALQRGLWTNTKSAEKYFTSITDGWINYEHNDDLLDLISLALNATSSGHKKANAILQEDITSFMQQVGPKRAE